MGKSVCVGGKCESERAEKRWLEPKDGLVSGRAILNIIETLKPINGFIYWKRR